MISQQLPDQSLVIWVSIIFIILGLLPLSYGVFFLLHPGKPMASRYGRAVHSRGVIIFISLINLALGLFIIALGAQGIYSHVNESPGVATGCIEHSQSITQGKGGYTSDYQTSCGDFTFWRALSLTPGATYNFQYVHMPNLIPGLGRENIVTEVQRVSQQ